MTVLIDDDQANPLGNEPVYLGDDCIGMTTSAAFGYRVGNAVALAVVDPRRLESGDGLSLSVDIEGVRYAGRITTGAAFDPDGDRMRRLGADA